MNFSAGETKQKLRALFFLIRNAESKNYDKGEILISPGTKEKRLYYVRRGIVRSFVVNEAGEEITFQLYAERQVLGNAHAILFDLPSRYAYQTLERTKVYTIKYDSFLKMVSESPKLLEYNRMLLGKRLIRQAFQRIESFVFLSPEERYQQLIQDHPKFLNRVPDKYIAHVLGITPVSLSRIRRRLLSKRS